MANVINHRRTRIVTLEKGEAILSHCQEGDIALVEDEHGWWTNFVGENHEVTGYDAPFESYNKALWTAKAAAEFDASE